MSDPVVPSATTADEDFHVVGVGASAGGLEALEQMFKAMPEDIGMAFVVVQHLSPDFKSVMDELLRRWTNLAVYQVVDGMKAQTNSIYLIPPGKQMIIVDGHLRLTDKDRDSHLSLPVDVFLRSLAQDLGPRAVAVILSGTGTDGSRGIRDVHEAGGLVICQSLASAKFDGMPRSASDTQVVDLFATPDEIPAILQRHRADPQSLLADPPRLGDRPSADIGAIFELLRDAFDVDFSHYKRNTVHRRIERRMMLLRVRDLASYLRLLERDREELNALYCDLLIGVTRFFRDPEAFARLDELVLTPLIRDKQPDEELRMWVAGCATGEEAYTLGILVAERMRQLGRQAPCKIFATDIHRDSLETAGKGDYDAAALENVPPEWIQRYFQVANGVYRIDGKIRQMIVFAPHNVIKDAPFTKLDVVTCRNLLIYLQPAAQKRALSLFHFGLRHGGTLMLGVSESPGEFEDEMEPIDPHWRLYRKRRDVRLPVTLVQAHPGERDRQRERERAGNELSRPGRYVPRGSDLYMMGFYDVLLDTLMPPALLVDANGQLLHKFGGAGRFLQEPDGRATDHVLDRLGVELRTAITAGFQRAIRDRKVSTFRGLVVQAGHQPQRCDLTIRPICNRRDESMAALIQFMPATPAEADDAHVDAGDVSPVNPDHVRALEAELRLTRENLQATIEELETSNEELQASNEELVASNEELQSTNEELNSVNEELYTVNSEFQQKIVELTQLTHDLENLLRSTRIHTLFLDRGLQIRRFTQGFAELFGLMPHDVGRGFDLFAHRLPGVEVIASCRGVLRDGQAREHELTTADGKTHLVRVLPYQAEGEVTGVVLTMVDISQVKQAQALFNVAFEAAGRAKLLVNPDGVIVLANSLAQSLTGRSSPDLVGRSFGSLFDPEDPDLPVIIESLSRPDEFSASEGRLLHLRGEPGRRVPVNVSINPIRSSGDTWYSLCALTPRTTVEIGAHDPDRTALELQALIENAEAAVYIKDLSGRMLLANSYCAQVMGLSCPQDALGRTTEELLSPAIAGPMVANDQLVIRTGRTIHVTETLDDGGRKRTFMSIKFPIHNREGQVFAVGGISTDITDEKQATERAEMAVTQRDRFLAMLSHELRNPLAAVVSAVRAMDHGDEQDRQQGLQIVREQTEHMRHLIDDLLDVARVSAGKITLRREPLDLRDVVRRAVKTLDSVLASRNQRLDLSLPEEAVALRGDAQRLHQVVVNLLSNASRFSEDGGTIWVKLLAHADDALLTVRDEGRGIRRDKLDHIFELFEQVGDDRDRSEGGLGIGLTLARQITTLHGGDITAYSAGLKQGSTFTVRLPRIRPDADESIRRVLLVDDNTPLVRMLARTLQRAGFETAVAFDGVEALDVAEQFNPHAFIIDVGLPVLNGLELASRLRSHRRHHNTLMIAISGYGQRQDVEASLQAGFNHHLVKPIDEDRLIGLLRGQGSEPPRLDLGLDLAAPPRSDSRSPDLALVASEAAVDVRPEPGGRLEIVLIEDAPTLRRVTAKLLRLEGHTVRACATAEEGWTAAAAQVPDLVLCDLSLEQGADGFEAARKFRQDSRFDRTCLLALSAYDQSYKEKAATEAGFDGYLAKPLDTQAMRQLYRRFRQRIESAADPVERPQAPEPS